MLGQFEAGVGVVPVGCPMARLASLVGRGRALEILIVGDDLDGPRAELYGYVNRVTADDQLDDEVEAISSRLARFDHDAIARTKSYVDQVMLPADSEISPSFDDARESLRVPHSRRIEPDSWRTGSAPTATSNGLSVGAGSRGLSRPELC